VVIFYPNKGGKRVLYKWSATEIKDYIDYVSERERKQQTFRAKIAVFMINKHHTSMLLICMDVHLLYLLRK
jgi:hypothetical protein